MAMNCKARCGKFLLLAVVGIAVVGGLVMALWNWLVPALFVGASKISYLQALGILVLSKILFGGLRGHGRWHGHGRGTRFDRMTPAEREKFRNGMHCFFGRCREEEAAPTEQAD